jgi:hypothetical protein
MFDALCRNSFVTSLFNLHVEDFTEVLNLILKNISKFISGQPCCSISVYRLEEISFCDCNSKITNIAAKTTAIVATIWSRLKFERPSFSLNAVKDVDSFTLF